ncbi:MAG: calcium-binding protein [Limisphaerales bacterium]
MQRPQFRFRPGIEPLETRIVPVVSVSFSNGTLTIDGDNSSNIVVLTVGAGNRVHVTRDGVLDATQPLLANVTNINAAMKQGNDQLDLSALTGYAGVSSLSGGENDDIIYGGPTKDTITGGNDKDTLEGRGGNDNISGNNGDDTIRGEGGDDELFGGAGTDNLFGGADKDIIEGGDQADFLFGEAGIDTLRGDGGADFLDGGTENDTCKGGNGNDTIHGGTGADTLEGGIEDDWLYDNIPFFHDSDADSLKGDGGADGYFAGPGDTKLGFSPPPGEGDFDI